MDYRNIIKKHNITAITFSSKDAAKGSIFVALVGAYTDGHNYIQDAFSRGCRHFLVERVPDISCDIKDKANFFIVSNTRIELGKLAKAFYGNICPLKIIGITGTKGKTTTASLVYECLNAMGKKCGFIGTTGAKLPGKSWPTKNTTPESLELFRLINEMKAEGAEYLVMEISSQALKYHRVDELRLELGAFLNIFKEDHIGPTEHPTYDDYLESKRKIWNIADKVIVNKDDAEFNAIVKGHKAITYAIDNQADYKVNNLRLGGTLENPITKFTLSSHDDTTFIANMMGRYNVYNIVSTIAILDQLGFHHGFEDVLKSIHIADRQNVFKVEGRYIIIDFAHNKDSVLALVHGVKDILRAQGKLSESKLILIYGTSGGRGIARPRGLAEAASKEVDFSIITNEVPFDEDPRELAYRIIDYLDKDHPYILELDRTQAFIEAFKVSKPGDIIMSIGAEAYITIKGHTIPYSERESIENLRAWAKEHPIK